jgi:hypothetical protein
MATRDAGRTEVKSYWKKYNKRFAKKRLVVQVKRKLMGLPAKPSWKEIVDAVLDGQSREWMAENLDPDTQSLYDAVMELYAGEQDQYDRYRDPRNDPLDSVAGVSD